MPAQRSLVLVFTHKNRGVDQRDGGVNIGSQSLLPLNASNFRISDSANPAIINERGLPSPFARFAFVDRLLVLAAKQLMGSNVPGGANRG